MKKILFKSSEEGKKLYKTFELKSTGDNGAVEGYASTWTTTPDSYGDVVVKGAFAETLAKKKATGHPFPLCFNHDFDQIIGAVNEIEEDDFGLKIRASFLNTPLAQEKRELVKEGIVWQFSFAYSIDGIERPTDEERKQGIQQKLTKLSLYEVSLVPVPANQTAIVTDVKSESGDTENKKDVLEKAGRRNSKKDADAIKQAITLLQGVLDNADESDEGKDDSKANGKPEEQKGSNPEKDRLLNYIKSL